MININNDWQKIIESEIKKEYFNNLIKYLCKEYNNSTVYPPKNQIFKALALTPFKNIKIVILGQDPYYKPNQANGLSFSVNKGVKLPPSLKNIYKELENDLNISTPNHGDLTQWAKEGVLLLNSTLTVENSKPNSHKDIGWQKFTDYIIKSINEKNDPVVFMLWGGFAISKSYLVNENIHKVLTAPHPSPLSAYRGFFNCKHFSKANNFLKNKGISPVNWTLK